MCVSVCVFCIAAPVEQSQGANGRRGTVAGVPLLQHRGTVEHPRHATRPGDVRRNAHAAKRLVKLYFRLLY